MAVCLPNLPCFRSAACFRSTFPPLLLFFALSLSVPSALLVSVEETLEEKDRRGMWKAARWYAQHLSAVATAVGMDESRVGRVTVLTNDRKVKVSFLPSRLFSSKTDRPLPAHEALS